MSDIIRLHGDKHFEIQDLLPWYAVGRLDPPERALVDAHLGGCADCQAELRLDHRLRGAVGDLPLDVEQGWAALRQAIDREPMDDRPKARDARNILAIFSRPIKLGWFLAAEAAFAAAAVVMFGHPAAPADYRALATPQPTGPGNVIVMFRPDAREGAVRAVLLASGARVTDGPTAAGAYVLSVPTGAMGLARLQASPQVTLAEPLDSEKPQ